MRLIKNIKNKKYKKVPPHSHSKEADIENDLLADLFLGDAMVRGLNPLGLSTLKKLKCTTHQFAKWAKKAFKKGLFPISFDFFHKYFSTSNLEKEEAITLLNIYGLCLDKMGKHDKALQVFKRVMEVDPQNPEAMNNIGLVYYHRDKFKSAKNIFRKLLH
jgi:tetratricopeptide (TPR) repeat protein